MNPKTIEAWACGVCGTSYADQQCAERCCRCMDCNAQTDPRRARCTPCREKREVASDQAMIDAARTITYAEYEHDWLYDDDHGEYHCDLDAMRDHEANSGLDAATWAWACRPVPFRLDMERVVGDVLEDHAEGAAESVSDEAVKRLQAFVDGWCKEQVVDSWEPDYSTRVLLPVDAP